MCSGERPRYARGDTARRKSMTERSERIDEEAEESLYENGALTHHRKELRNVFPATRR